jgi:hypothetical protein
MPDFDDPNDEEKLLKLSAEDNDTPYSPPSDIPTHDKLAKDAPQKDEIEDEEVYQEGENAAAGLQTDEEPDEDDHAIRLA